MRATALSVIAEKQAEALAALTAAKHVEAVRSPKQLRPGHPGHLGQKVGAGQTVQVQLALMSGGRVRQKGLEMILHQGVQGGVFGKASRVCRAIAAEAGRQAGAVRRAGVATMHASPFFRSESLTLGRSLFTPQSRILRASA